MGKTTEVFVPDGSGKGLKEVPVPRLFGVRVHPAADLFPMLTGDDFKALVEDVKKHGVYFATVYQGNVLLDGRNRLAAAEEAGLGLEDVPRVDLPESQSAIEFIATSNLKRRHLSTGERAELAVKLVPLFKAEAADRQKTGRALAPDGAKGKATAAAAKAAGVSPRTVERKLKAKGLTKARKPSVATAKPPKHVHKWVCQECGAEKK